MPIRSAAPTNRNPSPVRNFTDTSRHAACPSRQRKVDRKGVAACRLPRLQLAGEKCTRRPDVLQCAAESPASDYPDTAADDRSVQDLLSGLVTATGKLRFTTPSRSHCLPDHSNTILVPHATSRTISGPGEPITDSCCATTGSTAFDCARDINPAVAVTARASQQQVGWFR
jgi:hypothetical protein